LETVLLCSQDWPPSSDSPISASGVAGLNMWATTPASETFFKSGNVSSGNTWLKEAVKPGSSGSCL
jgi:hypothetical protein